jgi:hypothetical protein
MKFIGNSHLPSLASATSHSLSSFNGLPARRQPIQRVEKCNPFFDRDVSHTLESLSEALIRRTNSNYATYQAPPLPAKSSSLAVDEDSSYDQADFLAVENNYKSSGGSKLDEAKHHKRSIGGGIFMSETEKRKRLLNRLEDKHLNNLMVSLDSQSNKSLRFYKRQEAMVFDQVKFILLIY